MASLKIIGGAPLYGSVRLGGAKNASFKLMIASLLSKAEVRLLNFSNIKDVEITAEIIKSLGGKVSKRGERTMFVKSVGMDKHAIADKYGPLSRTAFGFRRKYTSGWIFQLIGCNGGG